MYICVFCLSAILKVHSGNHLSNKLWYILFFSQQWKPTKWWIIFVRVAVIRFHFIYIFIFPCKWWPWWLWWWWQMVIAYIYFFRKFVWLHHEDRRFCLKKSKILYFIWSVLLKERRNKINDSYCRDNTRINKFVSNICYVHRGLRTLAHYTHVTEHTCSCRCRVWLLTALFHPRSQNIMNHG